MKIVLIGYRGTGKSVVGAMVARRLGLRVIAMDACIVERAGMSIPEIVARQGWPAFRDMESALARELGALDNVLIDTGGGVIERPENIEALRQHARIIWLKASVETIVRRIRHGAERPSLTGAKSFTEEVEEVLARRNPLYASAAHHAIDTDRLTPAQVADRIVRLCR